MNLKDNLNMVKEELSSEEKFFEKAVITEKFVKKYKKLMIASVSVVALVIGANLIYDANKKSNIEAANATLLKLQSDVKNTAALKELKTLSPNLYDVWLLSQAIAAKDIETIKSLKSSNAPIVGDLAKYESSDTPALLDEYASRQDAIFRDLALLQSAVMLLNENKVDEAKDKLSKVSKDSPLSKMVLALMHYGLK